MSQAGGWIHDEHPFAVAAGERDPVRRLRGRLAAPVTLWTAGTGDRRVGLTVSSVLVAEPDLLVGVVGDETDLLAALEAVPAGTSDRGPDAKAGAKPDARADARADARSGAKAGAGSDLVPGPGPEEGGGAGGIRFAVTVLDWSRRVLADAFAFVAPAPGGPFAGHAWRDTEWGPVPAGGGVTWAGCTVRAIRPLGYGRLVEASVDHVEPGDDPDPLVWRRGHYRRLGT